MACITCDRSDSWHRSQIVNLERTIGPLAGLDFETAHPESDEDAAMTEADALKLGIVVQ
jgi:hypothetical protein